MANERNLKDFYLRSVVVICGGIVLALEILGTRVLGPFYGVSIYLWSALISITLLALSIGYFIGGRVADKSRDMMPVAGILGVSGAWLLLIPWLKHPVLAALEPLGLRFAVLAAGFVLFFIPLMLLGMISPLAIKLKSASLDRVGRTAGSLYALSTMASVVSALVTAYLLIPNIGVSNLLFGTGLLLILFSAAGFILENSRRSIVLCIVAAMLGAALWFVYAGRAASADHHLLTVRESPYAEMRVVDGKDSRYLLIDGSMHGNVDTSTWLSVYAYVSVMEMPKLIVEKPGSMLLIGLGAGSLAKSYTADGWSVDAVELDPVVVDLARDYFHLQPADGTVTIEDGRKFLLNCQKTYDVILLDAFGSSSIPFHLITKEMFGVIRGRLAPNGILAINCEAIGWKDIVVRLVGATLHTSFSNVTALPIAEPPDKFGNIVLLASNAPLALRKELPRNTFDPDYRFSNNYWKVHGWDNAFEPATPGTPVLTDELNPIDVWTEDVNYEGRKELHKYFASSELSW